MWPQVDKVGLLATTAVAGGRASSSAATCRFAQPCRFRVACIGSPRRRFHWLDSRWQTAAVGCEINSMAAPLCFEIETRQFALDGNWPPYFILWPEGHEPLCRVVETCWRYNAVKFLSSILARTGQSFEGAVSFAFHAQYPEEIAEGIRLDYLGVEQVVSEAWIDAFVACFARKAVELAAQDHVRLPEQVAALIVQLEQSPARRPETTT